MKEDNFDYGEDIEFDPKAGTYKEIVMIHFNRCMKSMSVEFRGGYYTIISTRDGTDKQIYIPDTREIYNNTVLALAMVLTPRYDDDMQAAYDKHDNDMLAIKKEFIEASSPDESIILGDGFYDNDDDRLLLEEYKQKKNALHLKLFYECSKLLGRKNYLTIGGMTF